MLRYVHEALPKLPDCARTGLRTLIESKPSFYPVPSWTYLSQLHGPKVKLPEQNWGLSFYEALDTCVGELKAAFAGQH